VEVSGGASPSATSTGRRRPTEATGPGTGPDDISGGDSSPEASLPEVRDGRGNSRGGRLSIATPPTPLLSIERLLSRRTVARARDNGGSAPACSPRLAMSFAGSSEA
jgi:hypothetical protein